MDCLSIPKSQSTETTGFFIHFSAVLLNSCWTSPIALPSAPVAAAQRATSDQVAHVSPDDGVPSCDAPPPPPLASFFPAGFSAAASVCTSGGEEGLAF